MCIRDSDSTVLTTVVVSKERKNYDFFPLTVDFNEKMYAAEMCIRDSLDDALLDVKRELARALLRGAPADTVREAGDVLDLLGLDPLALLRDGCGAVVCACLLYTSLRARRLHLPNALENTCEFSDNHHRSRRNTQMKRTTIRCFGCLSP